MAKSKILKELVNNQISLEIALSRLLIIANDIEDEELAKWAENELNGYLKDSKIPCYRTIRSFNLLYSGINGRFQITNKPLSIAIFDKKTIDKISINDFSDGIQSLQTFSDAEDGSVSIDLTYLAGIVEKNTGIQCINIRLVFAKSVFQKILGEVRTKLIKIFIELDKKFGCLDDLDISKLDGDIGKVKDTIYYIIYQDNSVKIGNDNKIEKSNFES